MDNELNRYLAALSETAKRGSYLTFARKFDSFAKEVKQLRKILSLEGRELSLYFFFNLFYNLKRC